MRVFHEQEWYRVRLVSFVSCGLGQETEDFFISQEIASCEIKSLRRDAQLAEKKPARARNKSCAAKVVARGVCEAHFLFFHRKLRPAKTDLENAFLTMRKIKI